MPRTTIKAMLGCAAGLAAHAAELTVEPAPFTVTQNLTATILPEKDSVMLPQLPEAWSDWAILSIKPHGSQVSKSEVLVEFDDRALTRKIEDTRLSITKQTLELAQAEQDLAHLQTSSAHQLDALRTAARIAREEWEYFSKTRRNAEERSADQSLEKARQYLANQEEELRQLKKMYEADDLTEETEEIILTRQKNAVTFATFALEMETLQHKRTREVLLPREAVDLENNSRNSAIALDQGTKSVPRSIELKTTAIAGLKTAIQRDKENLAALEKDLARMKIPAPADGWFFHGLIENGRWITGDAVKSLVPGGRPASSRPFATFIPAKAPASLFALADHAVARPLSAGLTGKAILAGREDLDIPATVANVSPSPSTDGKHTVVLRAAWPKDHSPAFGTSADIRIISYHNDAAIILPAKALQLDKDGHCVSVKLANGKTERRPVRQGLISGDKVEILKGLEKGQVVILPEP